MYSSFFSKRSIDSLDVLARNEGIDYKNMSYKIIFNDETNINFFKTFGTLYGLLKNLVTSKMNITDSNIDQIRFIAYLVLGYYDKDFFLLKR